jgi:hypothetical protein
MSDRARWVVGVVAALGIVLLLAFARNEPPVGGRIPDPGDVHVVVIQRES